MTGEKLYVEYRSGTGRDAQSFYGRVGSSNPNFAAGVRVLKLNGCASATGGCAGAASTVLPNGYNGVALVSGRPFKTYEENEYTFPGAKISVISTGSDTATVGVQFAPASPPTASVDGTPKVGVLLSPRTLYFPPDMTYTYAWSVGGLPVPEATRYYFTPRPEDVGKTVTVTATAIGTKLLTVTSAASAPVLPGTFISPQPYVYGTLKVGSALIAALGSGYPAHTVLTYQWMLDGLPVPGGTEYEFTPSPTDVGKRASVRVAYNADGYEPVVHTTPLSDPIVLGTLYTYRLPLIIGSPNIGSTLTADAGTWTDGTELSYQWSAGGTPITDATDSQYVLRSSDLGQTIMVAVTGTLLGYEDKTITSVPTEAVGDDIFTAGTPFITGTAKVDSVLTANPGAWMPGTVFTYQWRVAGTPVAGATGWGFAVRPADAGKTVTVAVTGSLAGYSDITVTSAPTATVAKGTFTGPIPAIAGTPKVGLTLTAKPGTWSSGTALTYQWYASGVAVRGATKTTFIPSSVHAGKTISVKVTASRAGYTTILRVSKVTAKVAKATVFSPAPPTISGTAKAGYTLRAKLGSTLSGATVTYRWYVAGIAVKGATSSSYVVRTVERKKAVTVRVAYAKPGYVSVSVLSAKRVIL